jgi:hypothetical protein
VELSCGLANQEFGQNKIKCGEESKVGEKHVKARTKAMHRAEIKEMRPCGSKISG